MEALAGTGTWLEGKRFSGNVSEADLQSWIDMGMTVLVIIHQILNRKWYGALFKGKYNPYRSISTVLNILLIASFVLTAFSGMSMSGHAVPFLYGMAPVSFARRMHLSMSHWAFVLMLSFWAFIGTQAALICRNAAGKV